MQTTISNRTIDSVVTTLRFTYGFVPIIAGADKFFNLLTNWEAYIDQSVVNILPFTPHVFMMIVGVIEIIAGMIVLAKPSIGGYIVAVWLTVIAIQLIAGSWFYDVAVRDVVMAIGAFSMARLARTTGM